MNFIENLFLNFGFSWTLSKSLPYILVIILGLFISIYLFKKLKLKRKWLTRLGIVLLTISFFFAYFAFAPIYEGDFSNNAERITRTKSNSEINGRKLVLIAIPGCQYCEGAMNRMKLLKKRNPELEIEYIVCSSDSSTLQNYIKLGEGQITISLAKNGQAMSELAEGRFPTFVLSEENLPLTRWSNDGFGVRALDQVESIVK